MNLEEALVKAFQEYNSFGLAAQSSTYHLADREMWGIKELWHNWFLLLSAWAVTWNSQHAMNSGLGLWGRSGSSPVDVEAPAGFHLGELRLGLAQ